MIFTFMRNNRDTDKNSVLCQENLGDIACFRQGKTPITQKKQEKQEK